MVYHMRRRPQSRNDIAGAESIIFRLEMLRVGRPFEDGSQRFACGRIPKCNPLFRADGCLE